MSQRDYYEVLGVARDVEGAELKKTYRKLALKYHPDRNDAPEAAVAFKEATEAYGVLSDPQKRARYDMGGHAAVDGGFDAAAFSDFSDLFSVFKDIFGGGAAGRRAGPRRGQDLHYELVLSFEEAALGAEKDLLLPRHAPCASCEGSGAEPGTERKRCTECEGGGQVVMRQGFFTMSRTCARCNGAGATVETPCTACEGEGVITTEKKLKIRVPAGVNDTQKIRVTGEGELGPAGGSPGDLFVHIRVEKHAYFWREGFDLHVQVPLAFPQVALGSKIEVPGLEGSIAVDVPAGTEAGEVIRMRGKGIRRLSGSGNGDLFVHVRVRTPRRLGDKQQKLLKAYAESLDESYDLSEEKSILERVKDIFA